MQEISISSDRSIALIHNFNEVRNRYVIPRLTDLAKALGANLYTYAWQPPLMKHGRCMALTRQWIMEMTDVAWLRYRGLRSRGCLFRTALFFKKIFFDLLLNSSEMERLRRFSQIEMMVSSKHVRAWEDFLESGANILMCFEDDVVFRECSKDQLGLVVEWLEGLPEGELAYADVAGGVDVDLLQVNQLASGRIPVGVLYAKPVTNTACGYVINRALAERFCANIQLRPWIRMIGIDWLMNVNFMALEKNGEFCRCLHADPLAFSHGTFSGEYKSWQAR